MRTLSKTVYLFDELNDSAKEKAREWYRQVSAYDNYFAEWVIEDAMQCAALLGIEIAPNKVYFSGFCQQGDGASFEGSYSYKKGALKAITEHTGGNDQTLIAIAKRLQEAQRVNFYRLGATITQSGNYYHAYTMRADVYRSDDVDFSADVDEEVLDCMRCFANWIYRNLENQYEYENSDEVIEENIRANTYEFDEDGERV